MGGLRSRMPLPLLSDVMPYNDSTQARHSPLGGGRQDVGVRGSADDVRDASGRRWIPCCGE